MGWQVDGELLYCIIIHDMRCKRERELYLETILQSTTCDNDIEVPS